MDKLIQSYLDPILAFTINTWLSLGPEIRHQIWLAWGAMTLIIILALWYPFFRKLLGHKKFRGTWYNEEQYEALLKILKEDQDSGNRVMRYDEIALLRKETAGVKGVGLDRSKTGY